MPISVCMAVYNGEKFLKEQIESILLQLGDKDELVIVDDCSTDNSVSIINSFTDNRIKLHLNNKNSRHVITFGKAIELSQNEIIFLCDQDDIWIKERAKTFIDYFQKMENVKLITSNFLCVNENGNIINNPLPTVSSEESFKYLRNISKIFLGKIGYYGCSMAFRNELKPFILPIPDYIEAHDLWIALIANMLKINLHIEEKTLYHRIHSKSASEIARKRKLIRKIITRVNYFKAINEIQKRKRKKCFI